MSVGQAPVLDETKGTMSLSKCAEEAKQKGWGPLVVFPEGTTSNGRGLLKFLPVFNGFDAAKSDCRVHVVGLKYVEASKDPWHKELVRYANIGHRYPYEEYSPSLTVGSKLSHVFWMLAQFANYLEVRYLPSEEVVMSPSGVQSSPSGGRSEEDPVSSQISGVLGQVLRLRKTGMNAEDKCDFLDYYYAQESKKAYSKRR
ncbi:hypothetical protein HK104_011195 [Borealophlyctis nickersoniae]|nr:hypothetical protein HK104_011195 [Borealophlyctis nickersoniae]